MNVVVSDYKASWILKCEVQELNCSCVRNVFNDASIEIYQFK